MTTITAAERARLRALAMAAQEYDRKGSVATASWTPPSQRHQGQRPRTARARGRVRDA